MTSPQRWWHGHLVTMLTLALMEQAPAEAEVSREMTIKLDQRNRPEPDLLVTTAAYDADRTWFAPDEVQLVIEVVSPESAHRDRTVKLGKYAEAGIPHYWCIEDEDGLPVVHVCELDKPTRAYAPAGIFRGSLKRPVPFEISLDLEKLTPPRKGSTRKPNRSKQPHGHTLKHNVERRAATCENVVSGWVFPAPPQHGRFIPACSVPLTGHRSCLTGQPLFTATRLRSPHPPGLVGPGRTSGSNNVHNVRWGASTRASWAKAPSESTGGA
ncbi:Putative restriction endonuclease [Streptomyces sp. MnatMP-M17]|nr:Putative restriction endonuclease [Streptomyces sp. MnatMP-M17]